MINKEITFDQLVQILKESSAMREIVAKLLTRETADENYSEARALVIKRIREVLGSVGGGKIPAIKWARENITKPVASYMGYPFGPTDTCMGLRDAKTLVEDIQDYSINI